MHAIHWQFRTFRKYMDSAALDVLLMLSTHINVRGRCWPTVRTLAEEIGCSTNTVEKGKRWLIEHCAIELVPYTERSGAQEKNLSASRHIYQLTGMIEVEGKQYPFWHLPPQTDNISENDISENDISDFETEDIDQNPKGFDQKEKDTLTANAVHQKSPFTSSPMDTPLNPPKHTPVGRPPMGGESIVIPKPKTVRNILWEGVVYGIWGYPEKASDELLNGCQSLATSFVNVIYTSSLSTEQALAFNVFLLKEYPGEYGKNLKDKKKYGKSFSDFLLRGQTPMGSHPGQVEDPLAPGFYTTQADLDQRAEAAEILAEKVRAFHANKTP